MVAFLEQLELQNLLSLFKLFDKPLPLLWLLMFRRLLQMSWASASESLTPARAPASTFPFVLLPLTPPAAVLALPLLPPRPAWWSVRPGRRPRAELAKVVYKVLKLSFNCRLFLVLSLLTNCPFPAKSYSGCQTLKLILIRRVVCFSFLYLPIPLT